MTRKKVAAVKRKRPEQPRVGYDVAAMQRNMRAQPRAHGLEQLDQMLHSAQARVTGGVSPAAVMNAYLDWFVHLANSPTNQTVLIHKAVNDGLRLMTYAGRSMLGAEAEPAARRDRRDPRFRAEEWKVWPYNLIAQSFLLSQSWWREATRDVRGVSAQHNREVQFLTRQFLDFLSPANFLWTNPEVLRRSFEEGGQNLVRGLENAVDDMQRNWLGERPVSAENYAVGENVAATPGKVVYRNALMELIQYSPATDTVWREPVLIVPAWIMKYYILDLSPENSLIRYLVSRGRTVFAISWKNPTAEDRDVYMDNYRRLGVMAALDVIAKIQPGARVHACGYCLGGTLLSIAAAAMARDGDRRLATITLLAAQTNFSEAGELMLFMDESQLSYIEDMMWAQGYLDTKEMSGAFQFLRANDLIWSRIIREYMLGEKDRLNDLMAWSTDQTRMPYHMHSEYLRQLFLENRLATGKYQVGGRPVALTDIEAEIFAVATIRDHIAPWQSVFKIKILSDTDVTFVLAAGGHNAGIVSEPGHANRSYQMMVLKELATFKDPEAFRGQAPVRSGSWWPAWARWLSQRSSNKIKPPSMGAPRNGVRILGDAPGRYVLAP